MTFEEWWNSLDPEDTPMYDADKRGLSKAASKIAWDAALENGDLATPMRWNPSTSRWESYNHTDDLGMKR